LTVLGLLPVLAALVFSAAAAGAREGNSANAKLCQKGGSETLTGSDGTTFADTGACVSYAARGGTFGTPDPPGPTWTLVVSACTTEPGFTCVDVAGSGLQPGSTVTLVRNSVFTQSALVAPTGGVSIVNSMTECQPGSYTFQASATAADGTAVTSDPFVASCGT
jgi:hypothetical protein